MKVRKRKKPKISRISNIELEKAIIYTLKTEDELTRQKLIKSASQHLGFKSLTPKVKGKFNQIIDKLIGIQIKENKGLIELI